MFILPDLYRTYIKQLPQFFYNTLRTAQSINTPLNGLAMLYDNFDFSKIDPKRLREILFDYSPADFRDSIANISLAFQTNGIDPEPYQDDFFKLKCLMDLLKEIEQQEEG